MAKKKALKDMPPEKRYFGIILEDIDSKMKLVLEGHSALDKKIDDFQDETRRNFKMTSIQYSVLNNKVENLNVKFENFREKTESNFKSVFQYLSHIDGQLSNIEARLNSVEKRLDNVEKRLDAMEKELQFIKLEIADLKPQIDKKADLERLTALEQRVENVEIVLARHKNQL